MGRAAPPSEAEIEAAAAALYAQALAGWLARLDCNYWSRRRVALASMQVLDDSAILDRPAGTMTATEKLAMDEFQLDKPIGMLP